MPYSPSVAKSITRSTPSTTRWPRSLRPWNMAGNLGTGSDGTYVLQAKLHRVERLHGNWLDQASSAGLERSSATPPEAVRRRRDRRELGRPRSAPDVAIAAVARRLPLDRRLDLSHLGDRLIGRRQRVHRARNDVHHALPALELSVDARE